KINRSTDKILRRNHKTNTDRRSQGLGQCPDIYYTSLLVQACHGHHRCTCIMKVVIVVVLNNSKPVFGSQFQKLYSPFGDKGNRRRIVMVGNNIDKAYAFLPAKLFYSFHIYSTFINGNIINGSTELAECESSTRIARFAYDDLITRS